jgi:uncharacterized protein YkwD
MRGWLRRLGCWEDVTEDGGEPPDEVVREVETAVGAYENVHGEKPWRQVFEVEYGDYLYRARTRGRRGDGGVRYYRAPNASALYRTGVGVVRGARRFNDEYGGRTAIFAVFASALITTAVLGIVGFGALGSPYDGMADTEPAVEANGSGVSASGDVLNGTFVFNEARAERLILEASNEVRREHGVAELRRVEALSDAATVHAGSLARNRYIGHVTPAGEDVGDRYVGACEAREYTENAAGVAFNESLDGWNGARLRTEEDVAGFVVDAWMGSEGHRETLLEADRNGTGVGVHLRDGKVFAVQAFCGSVR